MVVSVGEVSLETQRGDISLAKVDAVVNAANNHLWMGAGVAGALKRAGGAAIEREAVAKGPIELGQAVVTSAAISTPNTSFTLRSWDRISPPINPKSGRPRKIR